MINNLKYMALTTIIASYKKVLEFCINFNKKTGFIQSWS